MFWVDEIVKDIINKQSKDSYLVTDWKTPSGHVHIGAVRGVVIHGLITEGLRIADKKAIFQYGIDDFDPMDGMPVYIDESFRQYMGLPLSNVPAPDGKSENYAKQYANEFIKVIEHLGFEPKIVWSSELYQSGRFNEAIKISLDNAEKIRQINKEISGSDKGEDYFPFNVVCQNCGKVGTTKVTSWDGEKVKYECMKDFVDWAEGCGQKGEVIPYNGNGKLPWKAEWPSKWFIFNSDIEGEGKDHAAASGSRQVADKIYREVFSQTPPYDIPYEHILIGGAKMSSSKGLGVTAKQMSDLLPANILKFLFTRTKYKRAIEFNPEGDTIPLLYDEYDRTAEAYKTDPNLDMARAFFYTEKDLISSLPTYYLRFSKIANFLQMPRADIYAYAREEKGSDLNQVEKLEIESRIETAKKWLENFASDNVKFTIQTELPAVAKNLSVEQKSFMKNVAVKISTQEKWTGEDLHKEIHEIKNESGINPREAFSAIYLSFLGKDSGPQVGWLLASLDHDFVVKRLNEVV